MPPGARANKEQRVIAKGINFGIIYGLTAQGLMEDLAKEGVQISLETAQGYLDAVFKNRPQLKIWMDGTIARSRQQGLVASAFGRINYLPNINSSDRQDRGDAERKGINMPIQSLASDLNLWSALRIDKEIKKRNLQDKIILWNLVGMHRDDFQIGSRPTVLTISLKHFADDHIGM